MPSSKLVPLGFAPPLYTASLANMGSQMSDLVMLTLQTVVQERSREYNQEQGD